MSHISRRIYDQILIKK